MKFIKVIFNLFTSLALSWPILFTPSFAMQPTAQTKNIEIINAWYGDDAKNAQATYATSASVVPKLREVVNKYGFIAIPAQMHTFYGFDPLPNVAKKTAIHIRYNGKEEHLRAQEGKDFVFPANIDQTKVQQALKELTGTLSPISQTVNPTSGVTTRGIPAHATEQFITAVKERKFDSARATIDALNKKEISPFTIINKIPNDKTNPDMVNNLLDFAKYLFEKGYDINHKNSSGFSPIAMLAGHIADYYTYLTQERVNTFYGPLMEFYITSGASDEQIQKVREILTKAGCILVYPCPMGCPRCVLFKEYWVNKIEPLIQDRIKKKIITTQDITNAIETNNIEFLKQLIELQKISAQEVIELATKVRRYDIVQAVVESEIKQVKK